MSARPVRRTTKRRHPAVYFLAGAVSLGVYQLATTWAEAVNTAAACLPGQ